MKSLGILRPPTACCAVLCLAVATLQTGGIALFARSGPTPGGSRATYFDGPIAFEPNQGQSDADVKFIARGAGYILKLRRDTAELSFGKDTLDTVVAPRSPVVMKLVGTSPAPQVLATEELATTSSYFLGKNRAKWRMGIPNYQRVQFSGIYPGIDLVFHGNHGMLNCDFLVAPGASPREITISISGAGPPKIDSTGNVALGGHKAELRLLKPMAYQDIKGKLQSVGVQLTLRDNQIRFSVGTYDVTRPLALSPVLKYDAYLTTPDAASWPSAKQGRLNTDSLMDRH